MVSRQISVKRRSAKIIEVPSHARYPSISIHLDYPPCEAPDRVDGSAGFGELRVTDRTVVFRPLGGPHPFVLRQDGVLADGGAFPSGTRVCRYDREGLSLRSLSV